MKHHEHPPLLDVDRCLLRDNALLSLTRPDAAGILCKRSNISGWYKYWFSLNGSQLLYFETAQSARRGLLVGTISLFRHKLSIVNTIKRRREFEITDAASRLHVLRAESDAEMHWWIQQLSTARNKIPPAQPIDRAVSSAEAAETVVQSHLKVDHVLCVVHGIGVTSDILANNTKLLQESYADIMARVFPDVDFRVELLVIHWRDALTALDVHRKLRSVVPIAPAGSEGNPLREFMVHRIVDYVYYTHERYRLHIMREVARRLNEQIASFRARRPDFDGGISVMGHSLGAALVYDLMCRKVHDDQVLLQAEGMRLSFDADNLFCVGNPLGTFLGLDPTLGLGADMKGLPFRVYNIFKFHDPIATRLEPHSDIGYARVQPVTVPCWSNMGLRESSTQWLGTLWSGQRQEEGAETKDETDEGLTYLSSEQQRDVVRRGNDWRMDFALQVSSTMEEVSTAWSALRAHTEYWGNRDLMLMMVSCMIKTSRGMRDEDEMNGVLKELDGRIIDEHILSKSRSSMPSLESCVEGVVEELVAQAAAAYGKGVGKEQGGGGKCEEKDAGMDVGGWAAYLSSGWFGSEARSSKGGSNKNNLRVGAQRVR